MKENFINFLKEHDAYEKFIKNLKSADIYSSFDALCRVESFLDWISCSFDWEYSPEEFHFWHNLDNLWISYSLSLQNDDNI